jgi:hypothetical protein
MMLKHKHSTSENEKKLTAWPTSHIKLAIPATIFSLLLARAGKRRTSLMYGILLRKA